MRGDESTGWLSRMRDWAGTWMDKRDGKRLRANFHVTIEGTTGLLQAHLVDVSRQGIGVLSPQPVRRGLLVFISLSNGDLSGFAHVRYCTARPDGTFRLGLKFRDALHCKRPEPGKWIYRRISYSECGTWDDVAEISTLSPQ